MQDLWALSGFWIFFRAFTVDWQTFTTDQLVGKVRTHYSTFEFADYDTLGWYTRTYVVFIAITKSYFSLSSRKCCSFVLFSFLSIHRCDSFCSKTSTCHQFCLWIEINKWYCDERRHKSWIHFCVYALHFAYESFDLFDISFSTVRYIHNAWGIIVHCWIRPEKKTEATWSCSWTSSCDQSIWS